MTKFTRATLGLCAVAAIAYAAGRSDLFSGASALAQSTRDKPKATAAPQETGMDAAMMEAMAKYSVPGEHHARLEPAIGTFKGTIRFRMSPTDPWVESTGTVTRQWVLGKRFIHETVEAESDMGPYNAIGYIGYNTYDGRYEVLWMDDMNTAMNMEHATFDPTTKTMNMRSAHRNNMTGQITMGSGKWNMSNADRHTFEGTCAGPDGKEFRSFEGAFERVK